MSVFCQSATRRPVRLSPPLEDMLGLLSISRLTLIGIIDWNTLSIREASRCSGLLIHLNHNSLGVQDTVEFHIKLSDYHLCFRYL